MPRRGDGSKMSVKAYRKMIDSPSSGGKRVTGGHAREASTLIGNSTRASVHPTGQPHGTHDHHGELYERSSDGGIRQTTVHHDANCNDVDKK